MPQNQSYEKYIILNLINEFLKLINEIKQSYGINHGDLVHFYNEEGEYIDMTTINFPVIGILTKLNCFCCGDSETQFKLISDNETNIGD